MENVKGLENDIPNIQATILMCHRALELKRERLKREEEENEGGRALLNLNNCNDNNYGSNFRNRHL